MDDYSAKLLNNGFEIIKTPNKIVIKNDSITIIGTGDNALWTTYGVLCEECYGVSSQDNYVVVDIGLNIGVAALYFAQDAKITHIYGFEPFKKTYHQALVNLKNNEHLAEKIKTYNFGLGDKNKEITISYNSDMPGSMSTVVDTYAGTGSPETIQVKDVAEVLVPLIEKHSERILVKIDCEGSETEILTRLEETKLLASIDIILMEWHFHPPGELLDILKRNMFIAFFEHVVTNELGFIRAINRKLS